MGAARNIAGVCWERSWGHDYSILRLGWEPLEAYLDITGVDWSHWR